MSGRGLQRLVWLAAAAAVLPLALASAPAQAQNPITDRPSSRPLEQPGFLPEAPSGGFELPPALEPPAEGQEALEAGPKLEVKGFAFEGNKVVVDAGARRARRTVCRPHGQRRRAGASAPGHLPLRRRPRLHQLGRAAARRFLSRWHRPLPHRGRTGRSGAPAGSRPVAAVVCRGAPGAARRAAERQRPAGALPAAVDRPAVRQGQRAAGARRGARLGHAGRGCHARASVGPGCVRQQLPGAFDQCGGDWRHRDPAQSDRAGGYPRCDLATGAGRQCGVCIRLGRAGRVRNATPGPLRPPELHRAAGAPGCPGPNRARSMPTRWV